MRDDYGKWKGILLTGTFFAAMHFDTMRFIPLLAGGVVLTWLYEQTDSLWTSIIAHATWNMLNDCSDHRSEGYVVDKDKDRLVLGSMQKGI